MKASLADRPVIGPVAPGRPQTQGWSNTLAPASEARFNLARAKATAKPLPAPLAVSAGSQSHEIFAFAPYWTLPQESGFDVADTDTVVVLRGGRERNGPIESPVTAGPDIESQDLPT